MIVQNKNLSLFLAWFLRLWFENVEYHCWEDQLNEEEIESITYPVSVDDEKDIEIGGEEAKAALEQYKENQRKKGNLNLRLVSAPMSAATELALVSVNVKVLTKRDPITLVCIRKERGAPTALVTKKTVNTLYILNVLRFI